MILIKISDTSRKLMVLSLALLMSPLYAAEQAAVAQAPVSQVNGSATDTSPLKTIKKPQWEFGLAAAALKVPAYPASARENERQFLVPWFIYRGDKVRLQDGGLKLIALQNQRVTIDVSISGSLNADSQDTPIRQGMPDLDYLLEFGPKADVRIWDRKFADGLQSRLNWSTALRLALSTDFSSVRSRGPVLGTELSYRREGFNDDNTFVSLSLESLWSGEKLMDYIYQVDPAFATAQRPAYDARGGYLGSAISVGIGHDFTKQISGFVGVKHALHEGARNTDSPLFEETSNTGIFGGFSWTIRQSEATIDVLDAD